MPMLVATLTHVHPDRFDHEPLHRIGLELRAFLADTLTDPLTGDMLVTLHRQERIELELHEVRGNGRKNEAEVPHLFA